MAENLKALAALINDAVANIDSRCVELESPFPSLHTPISPDAPPARADQVVSDNVSILLSAATQLIASVKSPHTYIFNAACAYYLPSSIRVATDSHVPEILANAGPEGMHVNEISAKNGIQPSKLSRILRYLSVHHIFREVRPDVFALNRTASVLNTGKSLEEILENPLEKHDNTSGVAALVAHCTDEDMKGATYMLEQLTDPNVEDHDDPTNVALSRAFGHKGDAWSWYELPENEMRFKRFGAAMKGITSMQKPEAILHGYDWTSLPPNSVVVDVGGGIGASSLQLAKSFPELKLVVQDRPPVVKEGRELVRASTPQLLESGRVVFQEHDFFKTQPVQHPRIFLLKQISHDWSDSYAVRILRELRNAAEPVVVSPSNGLVKSGTELLLIDCIIPYVCDSDEYESSANIPGLTKSTAPAPLLPHFADTDPSPFYTDLSMFVEFNGQERTIGQLQALLNQAGWRIARVYPADGQSSYYPQVLAHPI
ncbi:S-adenosyl-L-methionine-dependent methyltransferase [Schizopora paradoxa]|uniref:S-adenosyl-L-methionine-dependent methyltransferase n=1 Tax=Schizopora paradoxa TaxID=27342 RepID=A0A0H2RMT6_9AGAM|nr:S-adenosyl-L-methionine-dependent methyltransferase [Schizopora paradoxa]